MMKMIFNICRAFKQTCVVFIYFMFVFPVYADVTVNKLEKNDKIVNNSSPLLTVSNEIAVNVAPKDRPGANDAAEIWVLQAEQWELTRSGETVLSLPVLNQLIGAWLPDRNRKIEVRYPGGEEGEFWVQELTDWMVSLGIPSNCIVVIPGSGADDMIKFALIM